MQYSTVQYCTVQYSTGVRWSRADWRCGTAVETACVQIDPWTVTRHGCIDVEVMCCWIGVHDNVCTKRRRLWNNLQCDYVTVASQYILVLAITFLLICLCVCVCVCVCAPAIRLVGVHWLRPFCWRHVTLRHRWRHRCPPVVSIDISAVLATHVYDCCVLVLAYLEGFTDLPVCYLYGYMYGVGQKNSTFSVHHTDATI